MATHVLHLATQPHHALVECLHLPAHAPSRLHFVCLPGNPGAVGFYDHYLRTVQAAAASAGAPLHVWCLGHTGHCAATASPARFTLAQQVAHKHAVIDAILRRQPGARLVLAGHSVGAHIALELLRALPPAAVVRAVLLTPTLSHIGRAPNGLRLRPVFSSPLFCAGTWAAMRALCALPEPLQRPLLRLAAPQAAAEPGAMAALLTLRHPDVPLQAAAMALDEFDRIGALDVGHVHTHGSKLSLYFVPGDGWVHDSDAAAMAAHVRAAPSGAGGHVHVCTDGHSHSFVLSARAAERVGALTWLWIRGDCLGGDSDSGGGDAAAQLPPATRRGGRRRGSPSPARAAGGRRRSLGGEGRVAVEGLPSFE